MEFVSILRFVVALAVVLGLIAGLAWLLKRYGAGRVVPGGRGRLAVVETTPLDARRRLVLIRRDDTEHLVILSQTGETVVETGIRHAGDRFADHLPAPDGASTTNRSPDSAP